MWWGWQPEALIFKGACTLPTPSPTAPSRVFLLPPTALHVACCHGASWRGAQSRSTNAGSSLLSPTPAKGHGGLGERGQLSGVEEGTGGREDGGEVRGRETFSLGFPLLNKPLIIHFFVLNHHFPQGYQRDWL